MDEKLRRSSPLLFSLALISLLVIGCSKPPATSPDGEPSNAETPPVTPSEASHPKGSVNNTKGENNTEQPKIDPIEPSTPPEDSDESLLRYANATEFRELVASKKGQIVLVDCWATWCPPCMKQFPHTVALHRAFQPKGLAVISLSFDQDPSQPESPETKEKVLRFLGRMTGATFDHLIARGEGDQPLYKQFGVPEGIPYYMLYDRQGQLVHEFGGTQGKPVAEIDAAVEKLLSQ